MDEQERTDAFVALAGGRANADRIDRVWKESWPHGTALDRLYGTALSKEEVFRLKAKREGFSAKVIDAFLAL
jgi:hypothetical protein